MRAPCLCSVLTSAALLIGVAMSAATPVARADPPAAPRADRGALTVPGASADLPRTPVGDQARWLEQASRRLPVSESDEEARLTPELRASLGAGGLTALLRRVGADRGVGVESFRPQPEREQNQASATVRGHPGRWLMVLVTDGRGRIAALQFAPLPGSWAEVDRRLSAVAPRGSLLAAELDPRGRCRSVHGVAEDTARPIGSAFKLYVLGALAEAIRSGTAHWSEQLPVRDAWKADTASTVGKLPAGSRLTLREYARDMIFYSDNSATDHLINRVGQAQVEAQQQRYGGCR